MLLAGLFACGQTTLEKEKASTTTTKGTNTGEITSEPTESLSLPIITIKTSEDDPFSTIISDKVDWLMKMYVETNDINYYNSNWGYVLYDTDGEGAMALFLGGDNPYGSVNAIYTFQNGVVEQKLNIDDSDAGDNRIYVLKTGYIRTEKLNGTPTKGYYHFENGQLKLVAGLGYYGDINGSVFRVDPSGTERDYFFDFIPDGTEVPITAEEGRRLVKAFNGDWEPAELDWKPLAEYGR